MKKLFQLMAIVGILSLFGCPYSSDIPVSEPSVKINKGLLGKYQTVEDQAIESQAYLEIKKHSETHYAVSDHKYSSSDSTFSVANYTAFESNVDGVSFFNIKEDDKPPFMIYRLDKISENSFRLTEVTDNIDEKFETTADFTAFLGKYKDLSFLYSKEETVYRRMN